MFPSSGLAVILCLLQVLGITADIDTGSFLIYNENHNKCIRVESATSLTVAPCNPHAKEQQFQWASESRVLSLSHKLCLGAVEIKDWVKVLLYECDEKSDLQHWQCKNATLFGLKGQDLHLNWGNRDERNIMIYKGSGLWSRWRIYGTRGDLCSKGYQEIFTIGGNAFGVPCQFPFKFGEKWFAECTKEGRNDGHLWCATETDYNTAKKWGFCPTQSTSHWDTDPVTGVQYQRNAQSALTWHQARKSCQQQGADLLSIVELHEQSYISGLTSTYGASLWIGLNALDSESGWQWINGNPFRYLNWAPGHPSSEPGLSCGTLNAAKASKWESEACTKKLGYICRKGNSTTLPPPPSNYQITSCLAAWVPYAGNCYKLDKSKVTWMDAKAACRKEGADLVSIHNIEEQSFIITQTGYTQLDSLWIGLNDLKNQMLFEWSDSSHVTFTHWKAGEPSHTANIQEDCVIIQGKDGKWADHMCEKTYGFMCKQKGSIGRPKGNQEELNPGCEMGWTRFGSYCYHIGIEANTFQESKKVCTILGSNLVDIRDRYESAFLVSLVGLRPEKYFWTGLSNVDEVSTFTWTTGRAVTFTHFNMEMPGRHQGCVAMTTGVFAGLWDVIGCTNTEKYICKKRAQGVPMTTVPPTTPALSCYAGWFPAGKRNVCVKLFERQSDLKKTWADARKFCLAIGGDLMSIHSSKDLANAPFHVSDGAWIGFSNQDPTQGFVWSDGSPTGYENWGYGEPNNHNNDELCAEATIYYGIHWNDRHCEFLNDWICQIPKGAAPKPEPVTIPVVYNTTDDGWLIYNDTHYFINTTPMPMENAREYCKKNFGDLVVITSNSERKFIWRQIVKSRLPQFYIGMQLDLDNTFSWLDGSPVTYTAWEHNEPNFANNDETCVTIYKNMGYWNDINCGLEFPSVCKRSSNFVNSTVAPTAIPKGGCAPKWLSFRGKCYKIEAGADNKNWKDARRHCIDQGGNLVSILNNKEQAFLTSQMIGYTDDFWTGMNDVNWEQRFVWTDGKAVKYTNWARGEPMSLSDEMYDCVMMVGGVSKYTGFWKVQDCRDTKGFICKRNPDSQILVAPTTVLPSAFYKLGNDSYKVVAQKMRWDEARRQCQADDAELASILNPVSEAYLSLQISRHNEPVWIGLNSNVTGGRFKWVDNWLLSYTKWGVDEPKNNDACVYMDVDRTWKTASCTDTYYSLCKRSQEIAPTEPPQIPGTCPESEGWIGWIPFRGHCYAIHTTVSGNWAHASVECLKLGAALLTIEDPQEAFFITQNLEIVQDGVKNFWLGLYKTNEGEWKWIDTSVVDYTNWDSGMPKTDKCVTISSETGKWSTTRCSRYRSFICKTSKSLIPTERPPYVAHVFEDPIPSSPGVTVAVVLVVIALIGLGGFLLFRKQIPLPTLGVPNFDNKLYFNNPIRAPVDTKGLVANIEQNEQS